MNRIIDFINLVSPENVSIICGMTKFKEINNLLGNYFDVGAISIVPDEEKLYFVTKEFLRHTPTNEIELEFKDWDFSMLIETAKQHLEDLKRISMIPGDEIKIKSSVNIEEGAESVYIVTRIEKDLYEGATFNWVECISKNGTTYSNTSDSFEKTGRHFDQINNALELIRRADNE